MKNGIKIPLACKVISQEGDQSRHRSSGGSKHPKHEFVYEANYGYTPGTMAQDGEEPDAYAFGFPDPVGHFTGICIAVIYRLDDDDDKLIVVPKSMADMSNEDIWKATNFQEQLFKSEIVKC